MQSAKGTLSLIFIIGSEFSYSVGSPSYKRISAFKKGFEALQHNVFIFSITQGKNAGLGRNKHLYEKKTTIGSLIKWCNLLYGIHKKFPNSVIFLSDLHNRYALLFILFHKLFRSSIIDIVEEPGAQYKEFNENPFFKAYKPGHIYHRLKAYFRAKFYYLVYWKKFNLRLVITPELKQLVEDKTEGKKTLLCPIIHFASNKNIDPVNSKDYFLHVASNSITKDNLEVLVEGFCLFINKSKSTTKLFLSDSFDPDLKEILNTGIRKCNKPDQIIFTGFLSAIELHELMQNAKALIVTKKNNSLNNYNFPTRLIEYLETKKPVIVPDLKSFKRYFHHNKNAFMYEHQNAGSLAEVFTYMNNMQEVELVRVGSNGYGLLDKEFKALNYCDMIISELKKAN